MQNKIEAAQKEFQHSTTLYNQQLEQDKKAAEDEEVNPEETTVEKSMVAMSSVGVRATSEQVTDSALKVSENAVKRRKCG